MPTTRDPPFPSLGSPPVMGDPQQRVGAGSGNDLGWRGPQPSRGTLGVTASPRCPAAVQHERGPRTSTIRKQVALYFRGHKEESGGAPHFPAAALPAPAFFTAVSQLEPHGLELAAVAGTPERQALVGLAQPTPKVRPRTSPRGYLAKSEA